MPVLYQEASAIYFPIQDYMSDEELSKHLGRQMSLHTEKYKEPNFEEELDEVIVRPFY